MNAELLNIADRAADESAPRACDFEGDTAMLIEHDNELPLRETSREDDSAHADFDSHEMICAVAKVPPKPIGRRPMSEDRSRLALAASISIAAHLGIGAICFAFATALIFVNPRQTDQRLGAAISEGALVDAAPSPNSDPSDPRQSPPPTPASPADPTDQHADASDGAAPAPTDAFAQAATNQQVAANVDSNEPPPMIGLPADPLAAPTFPKPKTAAAAPVNSPLQASATIAAHPTADSARSSVTPSPVVAPAKHVIGAARARGTPGGRRDGYELDDRGIPIPEYPIESRRRREEGLIKLDLEILPNGSVGRIAIIDDAGYSRLAAASVAAARAARFDAGTFDGQPIACHLIVPYRFTLR